MKKRKLRGLIAASIAIVAGCGLVACGKSSSKTSTTPPTPPTSETTKYSITYNANGHGDTPQALSDVTALPATLPTLSADGYVFGGWYLDAAFTTKATAGATISANTTLYAKWTQDTPAAPTTYSVTYNVNGHGEAQQALSDVTALPATLPVLSADGWKFGGWFTDAECTEAAVAGATISANTTLYAKWEPTLFTKISEDANKIYTNNFSESSDIPTFVDYGTKGLYQRINENSDSSKRPDYSVSTNINKAEIKDGAINLLDTTNNGTQVIYDLGNITSGKVEGVVDLTLINPGTSWAFFQLIGTDTEKTVASDIYSVTTTRTSKQTGILSRVDGNNNALLPFVSSGTGTLNFSEGLVLNIHFIFDVDNDNIKVVINDEFSIEVSNKGISNLSAIKFITSDNISNSTNKTLKVDNLAIKYTPASLEVYRAKILTSIDTTIEGMALDTNYTTKKTEIEEFITAKKALINAATTNDEVQEIYAAVVAYLEAVLTDAQITEITQKVSVISEAIADLPATDASAITILTYASVISEIREEVDALSDIEKTYLSESDLAKLEALEALVTKYEAEVTPLQRVEAKVNEDKAIFAAYVEEYFTVGYTTNKSQIDAKVAEHSAALDTILANANGKVTADNVDSYINNETGTIRATTQAYIILLYAIDSDLDIAKNNKIASLTELYNSDKDSYTDEYNLSQYTAAFEALKAEIIDCNTIAEVEAVTFDSMTSIRNDEEQIAYNSLPTYTVSKLVNSVKSEAFTSYTENSRLTDTIYGPFSVKKNGANMKMKAGYLDLFSGNTIEFTVENDGATFMIAYNSNTDARKVILTNSNTSIAPVSKYCTNLVQSTADAKGKYNFNGTDYELETSKKGWLKFENLAAGKYTVTFDTEEADKKPGAINQAEQKIEYLKLFDQELKDVGEKVLSLDATFSGSTITGITSSMVVSANIENSADPKTLASSEYTLEFYNSNDEIITEGEISYVIIKYTKDTKSVSVKKTL